MAKEISSFQRALQWEKILLRPHGSPGIWVSFLLPTAVIVGSLRVARLSDLYLSCAVYSFNIFLNVLHLLFHIDKHQSITVTRGLNLWCAIPVGITFYLYTEYLKLDFRRSLCYSVANALIYFEGILFLLKVFPRTFTFGEVNIVIQGLSLFLYGLFLRLQYTVDDGANLIDYEVVTVILQLALLWILVFCIVPFMFSGLRKAITMYIWGLIVLMSIYASVNVILNFDLFYYLWEFFTKPVRVSLIVLWLICSVTAVLVVQHQISKKKKSNTILRKYFHGLALIVFLSGIIFDDVFIYFCSACVFGLFIVLEAFRILKLPPFYEFLRDGFSAYSDEKDSGILALTPICLLIGNALPLWLHPDIQDSSKKQFQLLSGLLCVDVGDTFASVGGKLFGKHKWTGSNKTIEGTLFYILSQVLFILILVSFGLLQYSFELLVKALIGIFITAIVEAKTDQIDNIVLPLVMYTLLML